MGRPPPRGVTETVRKRLRELGLRRFGYVEFVQACWVGGAEGEASCANKVPPTPPGVLRKNMIPWELEDKARARISF